MATLHVRTEEAIAASIDRVWSILSDTSRYAEWVEATLEVTRTDGPARLGSTYDEINAVAGPIRGKSHWKVIEYDEPRRQVHRDESIPVMRFVDIVLETEPIDPRRTRFVLTVHAESKLGPVGALAVRALWGSWDASNRRNAAAFREIVEREAGSGGVGPGSLGAGAVQAPPAGQTSASVDRLTNSD
jgi:uncharacterized protein YndB with AHSA1/START domain